MSADLAPGDIVEMYRGEEGRDFRHGRRFTVTRVWFDEALGPCDNCLPGWDAPCMELAEYTPPTPDLVVCSCCFRPVRRGQSEQSKTTSTPAPPRECVET